MDGLVVPKHPTLTACTKQTCQQIVDCKALELKSLITTEREKRIRESHDRLESTIQLRIQNETMSMQKSLEAEIRKNHDDLLLEMRNTLNARLTFLTEQIERNTKSIGELRSLLSDYREDTKEDITALKQSIRDCDQKANKNLAACRSLDANIKQCINAINSE